MQKAASLCPRLFAMLVLLCAGPLARAQTTETFETEAGGSTTFADNGQVFNITSQARGPFDIQVGYPGTGWNGTANDNVYIDNDGFAAAGQGTGFTLSSAGNVPFRVIRMWMYLASNTNNLVVTGTLTIVGKLAGATVFTASATSPFNNTNLAIANGFTLIDMATFGGANHVGQYVDQLVFTTTNSFNYVALDAITWTKVAAPPTATNLTAAESYTEDTPQNLVDIVVSDPDSATVTAFLVLSNPLAGSLSTATSGVVTSTYAAGSGVWTASGPIASVNALLAGVTFLPALNFNGSFTMATNVSDGISSVTGTKVMTGIAANDPPTATNLSAAESYTEDTPLNLVDIVASDIDSPSLTVTLVLSNPSAGSLSTATSGVVTSTYVAATGSWTASGTISDVNALLAGVSFAPAANFNGSFTIATSVSDGVAPALTGTKVMTGIAANDPPSATNLSAAESYTEDTPLNLVDIVVGDPDSAAVTVTLVLSNPSAGSLSTATSGVVTSTYVAATGTWTASGTISDVNALLAGVSFAPAANFNGNFTISTSVSDGVASALTGTKVMTGVAVSDCGPNPCLNGGMCADVATGFLCSCALGFAGMLCEVNVDDCSPNPCLNGGTCSDGVASFSCSCTPGFTGATCGTNIDDCSPNPCLNGGMCTDGVASFTCACTVGFSGSACAVNVDDCATNPCVNGGTCVDGVNSFTCNCAAGFTGTTCAVDINDCDPNPCLSGGTCADGINTFTCTCAAGYNGATCQTNVDDCSPNPCLNGGTCTDGINAFTCACASGFDGMTCGNNIDECATQPCLHGGTCADGINGYTCGCVAGYNGVNCETDINDCSPNPCLNGGTCTDAVNGFTCDCPPSFTGTTCETGVSVDAGAAADSGTAPADSGTATVDSGTATVDGGTVDGGTVDGGTVDGGTVDSGTATVDGGVTTRDGGTTARDGGTAMGDGGTAAEADAGNNGPDEGSGSGCGCTTDRNQPPQAALLAALLVMGALARGHRSRRGKQRTRD